MKIKINDNVYSEDTFIIGIRLLFETFKLMQGRTFLIKEKNNILYVYKKFGGLIYTIELLIDS